MKKSLPDGFAGGPAAHDTEWDLIGLSHFERGIGWHHRR